MVLSINQLPLVQPKVALGVQWYKVVKLGEDQLTAPFYVDSPFSTKYGGSATPSTPGNYGRPGQASSPYPGCDVNGQPVDPRNYYVYQTGTTWRSGAPSTDAWSPNCGGSCTAGNCEKGQRMPLWIVAGSELVNSAAPTSVASATNLNSGTRTCASQASTTSPSCPQPGAGVGCTVTCQYPYINGDGGTQHRGVALSPAPCQDPGQIFR